MNKKTPKKVVVSPPPPAVEVDAEDLDTVREEKLSRVRAVMDRLNADRSLRPTQHIRMASELPQYDRISTGILSVDLCMGGTAERGFGFPRGLRTQLTGAESCFKTTTLLRTAANVQRMGGLVAWIQAEEFNREWAEQQGVDVDQVVLIPGVEAGDKALDQFVEILESGAVDFGVIDSVQGMSTTRAMDETETGGSGYGSGAPQMWGLALLKIARAQNGAAAHTAVAWTSQVRAKIGGYSKGEPLQGTQINSIKHSKCIDMEFRKTEALYTRTDGVYGRKFGVKNRKNKTFRPELSGEFTIYFEEYGGNPVGYDEADDALNWAVALGVASSGGAWYSVPCLGDGGRFNGREKFKEAMRADPEALAKVVAAIYEAAV